MRIGILTFDYDPPIGGLGKHVLGLRGMLQTISSDDYCVIASTEKSDIRVPWIARRWKGKPGACPMFSWSMVFFLRRVIRRERFDLLHAQSGSGGVFLLRHPGIPFIVTAHHTYIDEVRLVYHNAHWMKRLWKRFMAMFEQHTYRMADHVIAVSSDTKQSLVRHYGIDEKKISVIENSIDTTKWREKNPVKRDGSHIVFVGRLEPRKGVDTLLKAFVTLHQMMPTARLTLAGRNLMGDEIASFIDRHGLPSSVSLLGHVDEKTFDHLLSTGTILVVPSVLEGFGLIAAEGMCAGIPIIVSDAPGVSTLVRHERTGLIVETGNADQWAAAMEEFLCDPNKRERFASAARTEALQRFDPMLQAQKTHDIYERFSTAHRKI